MANAVIEPSYVMVLMKKTKQNKTKSTISFLSRTTLINISHHHVCQTEMAYRLLYDTVRKRVRQLMMGFSTGVQFVMSSMFK